MKRFFLRALFVMELVTGSLFSIDYSPWFERVLYFQGRVLVEGQLGEKHTKLLHNEFALKVTPWTDIRAEIELNAFASNHYGYTFEAFKAAGQYRFMNDIVGDPITLVAGATLIIPSSQAKHERALFYPGSEMIEAHLIGGKTFEESGRWFDRLAGGVAYGVANERSPWWRLRGEATWMLCRSTELALFLSSLAGGGARAIELGGIYRYPTDWGIFSLTYMRRPIADRLPTVTSVTLQFETPLAF